MKIFVLIAFILTYVLIIAIPKKKALITGIIAVSVAVVCLIAKQMDIKGVLLSIDYNVVMMLFGIMLTVGILEKSNMPNYLSDKLIAKVPNTLVAITLLCVISGVVSAFVDNVATVLMLAPIGLAVARKTNISPIPVLICIAVSSNLQGAATLVGDTTSVMLASFADMGFFDFFFLNGKFSIFWAVELGALVTIPVILFVFRKNNVKLSYTQEKINVTSVFPSVALLLNIVCLATVSFLPFSWKYINGTVCMAFGVITLVYYVIRFKENALKITVKSVDFQTVGFLAGLFVIIGAVESVGIIEDISGWFVSFGNNPFLLYTVIVFASVLLSAFIDNIPYVATMLPVIKGICATISGINPFVMYFGLLIGATLGGNLTPVGASANVVGIGILEKEGYKVKYKDFFKIGIPFTLLAVLVGYGFVWLVWGL